MLAADTSSLIPYFAGEAGADVGLIHAALADSRLCISPVVLAEFLSDPKSRHQLDPVITGWPLLEITAGYWLRASETRARLIALKLAPRLPDTLIAQSSIDYGVPLVTRDVGFRHFAKYCGLKLA